MANSVMGQKELIKKKKESSKSVSFRSIFMHADGYDMALMGMGLLGAIGDGVSMPAMLLVTSKLMNSFGTSQVSLSENFTHSINKVSFLSILECWITYLIMPSISWFT